MEYTALHSLAIQGEGSLAVPPDGASNGFLVIHKEIQALDNSGTGGDERNRRLLSRIFGGHRVVQRRWMTSATSPCWAVRTARNTTLVYHRPRQLEQPGQRTVHPSDDVERSPSAPVVRLKPQYRPRTSTWRLRGRPATLNSPAGALRSGCSTPYVHAFQRPHDERGSETPPKRKHRLDLFRQLNGQGDHEQDRR